jgi:hypothetical protein
MNNADENKLHFITKEPLLKNYKKQYIYSSTEDSEGVCVFERSDAGLNKP